MIDQRLQQQLDFIMEIDKLKNVYRQSYVSDGSRHEEDADHSWHLALMCLLLSEYANEDIDVLRTMSMVLIHDIIEIDAGDTYAYDEVGNATKRKREEKAADRIFNILPQDQAKYLRELWEEFEEGKTNEARFAITLDKVQPLMLNDATNGRAWQEHGVRLSQIMERNKTTSNGSEVLWKYSKMLIDKNVEKGKIVED